MRALLALLFDGVPDRRALSGPSGDAGALRRRVDFARLDADMVAACARVRIWYERLIEEPARPGGARTPSEAQRGKRRDDHLVGEEAPDFTMPTDGNGGGQAVELRGKPVVLYFYPKDDTPGCTAEACGFRDPSRISARPARSVIGVSRTVASHDKFKEKHELPFILASDADGKVTERTASGSRRACMAANTWASTAPPS